MVRKKLLPLLLTLILLPGFIVTTAQGWEQKYSPDLRMGINSVYLLPNSTYITSGIDDSSGKQRIMNVDVNNHAIWHQDYDSITGAATNIAQNNGYLMLGANPYDLANQTLTYKVLRVNSAGQKVWLKSIYAAQYQPPPNNPESYFALDTTNDGGVICAINPYDTTGSIYNQFYKITIIRVDSMGNTVWLHTLLTNDSTASQSYVSDIRNSKDGGFLISVLSYLNPDINTLYKIDSAGNLLWSYNPSAPFWGQPYAMAIAKDGNILISGGWHAYYSFVAKISQAGNVLWLQEYVPAHGLDFQGNLIELPGNRYASVSTYNVGNSDSNLGFLIVDSAGNIIAQHAISTVQMSSDGAQLTLESNKDLIATADGGYLFGGIITGDPQHYSGFLIKLDSTGQVYNSNLSGYVYNDVNNNCTRDTSEMGLNPCLISFVGATDSFLVAVDNSGHYSVNIDTGTYHVSITTPSVYWAVGSCPGLQLTIAPGEDTVISYAVDAVVNAPYLVLDAYAPPVHSTHAPANYILQYCNTGTAAFTGVINVTLDTLAHVDTASQPWTAVLPGNEYVFKVDSLGTGECATIEINYWVNFTSNTTGRSLCISAEALADTVEIQSAQWDRSNLLMKAACSNTGDSVNFTLRNTSNGDMNGTEKMLVIEDNVILSITPIQLLAGQSYVFAEPANGSTWRATVPQTPLNPYSYFTTAAVEGCGSNPPHLGYINDFAINGYYGFNYTVCTTVEAPYDPNHKSVTPAGAGADHLVDSSTVLEYSIEFQNTGNAPAINVSIIDTLSAYLNPVTIKPGVSSYPYTMVFLANNVIQFTFTNINLPDSGVSQPGSQGFVNYTISQYHRNPGGTVINNDAAIYFDYNPAIITNTATVIVGQLTVEAVQNLNTSIPIKVNAYPNPFGDQTYIEVDGANFNDMQLNVFDLTGRLVTQQRVTNSNHFIINRNTLSSGSYIFEISSGGQALAKGKLMAQ